MVERQIMESGLSYTLLRPTGFMQNFVNYDSARIAAESVLRSPRREAQVSWVDVRDIAAAAVAVLTEEGHDGRVYDLTGPEALSDQESLRSSPPRPEGRSATSRSQTPTGSS